MKRIISILLVTALLIGMLPVMVTAAADTTEYQYAVITSANGYKVRMREGPSKVYDPIDSYPVGTTVIVLQNGMEWSQIRIGDVTGWMMSEFLIFGATGGGTGSAGSSTNAWVISDNGLRVWLRATAGGKRLFLNAEGTPVTVLEYGDEWCRISINGIIGYMMTEYIGFPEKEEPKPEPPKGGRITSVAMNYPYPTVLDTLSVTTVPADAVVKYSWQVYDGVSWVERGTEATFEVLTRYANQQIRCVVTGVDPYTGSATATSEKVQISRSLSAVSLNNTRPVVGDVLKAILQPSSAIVEYSWRVGGVEVSDAEEYLVQASDVGKMIQLKVSGINGYSGSTACSADEVVASDKAVQSVTINDSTPVVGQTLSSTVRPANASVSYAWSADGATVGTGSTYQVTEREMGKQITLTVTGKSPFTGSVSFSTENVTRAALSSVSLTSSSPLVGDTIYATVSPSGASAKYTWHIYETGSDEDPIIASGESSSLKLAETMNGYDLIGERIFVVAEGTGIYHGTVNSGRTGVVQSNKKITGVSLNSSTPVVNDTLKAKLAPDYLNDSKNAALKESFTYVWEVGSEKHTTYGSSYKVQATDKGKQIRVRVVGTGDYSGDAYSGYTSAVVDESKLTGVRITNITTDTDATSVSPEVGQTLEACALPEPADAFVSYQWIRDDYVVGTGKTYTLTYNDYDEGRIEVEVTPKSGTNYDPEVSRSARTARIIYKTALNETLAIPVPVAGDKPVTSLSKEDVYSASITWLDQATDSVASMDQYGNFKPNTAYRAKIVLTPDSDYTLFNAKIKIKATGLYANQDEPASKIFYYDFPSTGVQDVNNFYFADLAAPVIDASGHEYDMVCSNDQLYGEVLAWNDSEAPKYTATIKLHPKSGYTLDNLPANVFKVNGATSCTYAAGSDIITVTFEMEPELYITSNKTEVYQDGLSRQIVHLTATLTNWDETNPVNVEWKVINPTTDATLIYQNGQLVIGQDEMPDRSLIVEAKLKIPTQTEPLKATIELPIISGTPADTALNVVFTKSPTNLVVGGKYTFSAYVANSLIGCELFMLGSDGSAEHLGTNEFTWDLTNGMPGTGLPVQTGTYIIKAIANENHAVTGTLAVMVRPSITLDASIPDTVMHGVEVPVSATVFGSSNTGYKIYVNGKESSSPIKTGDYKAGEILTIKVVSDADATVTDTKSMLIMDAPTITIDSSTLTRYELTDNSSYEIKANLTGAAVTDYTYTLVVNGNPVNGTRIVPARDLIEGRNTLKVVSKQFTYASDTLNVTAIYPKKIAMEALASQLDWSAEPVKINVTVEGTELATKTATVFANDVALADGMLDPSNYNVDDEVTIYAVADSDASLKTSETKIKITGTKGIEFDNLQENMTLPKDTPAFEVLATVRGLKNTGYEVWCEGKLLQDGVLDVMQYANKPSINVAVRSIADNSINKIIAITLDDSGYVESKITFTSPQQGWTLNPTDSFLVQVTVEGTLITDTNACTLYVNGVPMKDMTFAPKDYEGEITLMVEMKEDTSVNESITVKVRQESSVSLDNTGGSIDWSAAPVKITATVKGSELENRSYKIMSVVSGSGSSASELPNATLNPKDYNSGNVVEVWAVLVDDSTIMSEKVRFSITGDVKVKLPWQSPTLVLGEYYDFSAEVIGLHGVTPVVEIYCNGNFITSSPQITFGRETFKDGDKISVAAYVEGRNDIPAAHLDDLTIVDTSKAASGIMLLGDELDDPYANVLSGLSAGLDSNITITSSASAAATGEGTGTETTTGEGTGTETTTGEGTGTETATGEGTGTETATGEGTGTETTTGEGTGTETATGEGTGTETTTGEGTGTETTTGESTGTTTTAGGATISVTNLDGTAANIQIIEEDDEDDENGDDKKNESAGQKNSTDMKLTKVKKTSTESTEDEEALLTEEELAELEATTEGESDAEADIKVSITKKAAQVARGKYSTYEASISGSEKGVRWTVYHSVDDASSIDQDGKLTIGENEKAEELTVVAASRENGKIRAYCKVKVVDPSVEKSETTATESNTSTTPDASTTTTDSTTQTSTGADNQNTNSNTGDSSNTPATEEGEEGPSAKEMEEIWNLLLEEEKKQLENANSIYDLF